ncbi:MAG: hypothetical protein IPH59_00710 [bacterium]|nr:hypothetical protein [bacterium]
MGKGCKVLLIVGIVILALVIVGGIIGYTQCDKIQSFAATKAVESMEKDVLANIPEGFNVDEVKATLTELKDKMKQLVAEKKLDFTKMSPMVNQFKESMKDRKLTAEELDKLIEQIREFIKSS